jgi:hypothetical protein
MVGEYLRGGVTQQITGIGSPAPALYVNIQPLVVPPGDWDLSAIAIFSFNLESGYFLLSPVPAGINPLDNMAGWVGPISTPITWTVEIQGGIQAVGPRVQGSFSTPTLLPFSVAIIGHDIPTGTQAPWSFIVSARRMR